MKSNYGCVDISEGYELEHELSELLNNIVEHCIKSWYFHISDCHTPVNDAQLLISEVVKRLVCCFSNVDRYRLLCRILLVYQHHLSCFGSNNTEHHCDTSCIYCRNILSSSNVACRNNKQLADSDCRDTERHLNNIVFRIASKFIDEHYGSCLLGKEILSQIIVKGVILRAVDIASQPEWLYNFLADILLDSNDEHSVTNDSCTDTSSSTTAAGLQDSSSSCYSFNNMIDYFEPQATAIEDLALCESVGNTGVASSDAVLHEEQLAELADSVLGSYNDEYDFINGWFNHSSANDRTAISLSNVAAESTDCRSSHSVTEFSQDANHKDRTRPRSDSELLVSVRQNGLEPSANGDVYCNANTLPEALSDNTGNHIAGTRFQCPISPAKKKRFSLGDLLPSFKTQSENQKALDFQSAVNVVHWMPTCDKNQTKQDSVAETSFCTVSSSQHTALTTQTVRSSLKDDDYDDDDDDEYDYGDLNIRAPISHSASINVLLPESGSDEAANFLSPHLSHSDGRVSSRSVHVPHNASIEVESASDAEIDTQTSIAETSRDFIRHYPPRFLFESVCISETERDFPVSKPYTVYVISVRIICSFIPRDAL